MHFGLQPSKYRQAFAKAAVRKHQKWSGLKTTEVCFPQSRGYKAKIKVLAGAYAPSEAHRTESFLAPSQLLVDCW